MFYFLEKHFFIVAFELPLKNLFLKGFLLVSYCRYTFTSFFKDTSYKSENYFLIVCLLMEGSGSVQIITDPDPTGPNI
jgi:hypothetical protein